MEVGEKLGDIECYPLYPSAVGSCSGAVVDAVISQILLSYRVDAC